MAFLRPGQFLSGVPCRLFVLFLALVSADPAIGYAAIPTNITHDGTLGTTVTPNGNVFDINGGTIKGTNQFHSFGRFSVGTGDIASFNGPNTIANILSRVTGGLHSQIDGTLRSTIPGANLYLMNPAGVLFGPNSSLDLSGSFHVTTADYLRMTDGAKFYADIAKPSVLSVAPVTAFGFLNERPASIIVENSSIQVSTGQTLSLVGGDLTIQGDAFLTFLGIPTINAPSGLINLASVGSPGEVVLGPVETGKGLQMEGFLEQASISVQPGTLISTAGDGAGSVLIRAKDLSLNAAFIFSDVLGDRAGAPLAIDAQLVQKATITNGAAITADVLGAGDAGEVRFLTRQLVLDREALIASRTWGAGHAGNVVLDVENLTVAGGAAIAASTFGPGTAGTVRAIATETLNVRGSNADITLASGLFAQAQGTGTDAGNGGDVVLMAKNISIEGGAQIDASTFGPGTGGTVRAIATETLSVTGRTADGMFPSGLFSNTNSTRPDAGKGGDIVVAAKNIFVAEGAHIDSVTSGPGEGGTVRVTADETLIVKGSGANGTRSSGFRTNAQGTEPNAGKGGDIIVTAKNISIEEGAQIGAGTFGPGEGGTLRVTAAETLTLTGTREDGTIGGLFGSSDFVRGTAPTTGKGGDLIVQAKNIVIVGGAEIAAGTFGPGAGGMVTVTASDSLFISGTLSGVFTNSEGGSGRGGDIQIRSGNITLTDGGAISASSTGAGNAGNIILTVTDLTMRNNARIDSKTSGSGKGGNIQIAANSVEILGPRDRTSFSGISTDTEGSGDAGMISLSAQSLAVDQHGTIDSSGSIGSRGNAGIIDVTAETISLTNGAIISTAAFGIGQGGSLNLNASRSIILSGSDDFGNASIIASSSFSTGNAGSIVMSTPLLSLDSGAVTTSSLAGSGNGGDVAINVGTLTLLNGARIESGTRTRGRAGDVVVNARDSVTMSGLTPTGLFTSAVDPSVVDRSRGRSTIGDGGKIFVGTPLLTMDGVGQISAGTFSNGNAGAIQLNVGTLKMLGDSRIESSTSLTGAIGNAGTIAINAERVFLLENSTVATGTFNTGAAGTLSIIASDLVSISDRGALLSNSGSPGATGPGQAGQIIVTTPTLTMTRGLIDVATFGAGAAGGILLNVGQASLNNGAQISSDTFGSGRGGDVTMLASKDVTISGKDGIRTSGLFSNTSSTGDAGKVSLSAASLNMTDSGEIESASTGTGKGGTISINVDAASVSGNARLFTGAQNIGAGGDLTLTARQILLTDGGRISAESTGTGNAGNIQIIASDSFLSRNGVVTTQANNSDGGNITLQVGSLVHLVQSDITTSVGAGAGNGGNITIDPQVFTLVHSRIIANAFGGNGGNINITAGVFLVDPSSVLSASSALGVSGVVAIQSPVQNLSGTLSPLPSTLLTIAPLTSQCAARAQGGSFSSFTVAGRDGVPAEPGGLLPSPLHSLEAQTVATSSEGGLDLAGGQSQLVVLNVLNGDAGCTR